MPSTDPLKLIKSATVPLLSGEKRKKQATPLEFLVQVHSTLDSILCSVCTDKQI
jgi:hypothetical protein